MSVKFKPLLLLAATLALAFGLIEAIEIAAFRPVPWVQPMTKASLDVVWVAPAVHLLIGAAIATVLWLVARVGVPMPSTLVPAVLAFPGALAVAMYSGFLGLYGSLLLAAGLSVQVGRWLAGARPDGLRRAALALVVLIAVSTVALRSADAWARTDTGAAPGTNAPNVLVIVLDTVRADHLSAYGYGKPTPTIDRLAAEGTLFERAFASSSWTLPSHASLLTGLSQGQHGAESVNAVLVPGHAQLQERFKARGYRTGAFVANNIFFIPERGFGPGFQVFDVHYLRSLIARTTWGRSAKKAARRFLHMELDPFRPAQAITGAFERWRRDDDTRPFFAVLNFMDAHEPYHPGVRPANLPLWDLRNRRSAAENAELVRDYDDSIRLIDTELGKLVERASTAGWLDNTVVVLLADHGEAISDNSFDHGSDLTVEQIHVPLLLRLPGRVPAGVRVASPVSITDVAATIDDLAGTAAAPPVPGVSLTRWYTGNPAPEPVLSELVDPNRTPSQHLRAVIADGHELIHNVETSAERLFALSDLGGTNDLAANPASSEVLARLRQALAATQKARQAN